MGIRETLNKNPAAAAGGTVVIIILVIGFIVWQNGSIGGGPKIADKAYFSSDDGKTFFADEGTKIAPFDHGGQPAYVAHVFQCGSGKPFVAYLEKWTDDGKKKVEALKAKGVTNGDEISALSETAIEIRRPGETKWVNQQNAKYADISNPKCPQGDSGELTPVIPQ